MSVDLDILDALNQVNQNNLAETEEEQSPVIKSESNKFPVYNNNEDEEDMEDS